MATPLSYTVERRGWSLMRHVRFRDLLCDARWGAPSERPLYRLAQRPLCGTTLCKRCPLRLQERCLNSWIVAKQEVIRPPTVTPRCRCSLKTGSGKFIPGAANLPKSGLFRQFGFTFPDSRFYGNLPTTQIDQNRSISELPCWQQLRITRCVSYAISDYAPRRRAHRLHH